PGGDPGAAPPPGRVAGGAGDEVVHAHDVPALAEEEFTEVRADETRSTRDEHPHRGVLRSADGRTTDGVVLEAEGPHALGLPEVPTIEHDGPAHHAAQPFEVQELELVPLRD